jgi:hypothetical protein
MELFPPRPVESEYIRGLLLGLVALVKTLIFKGFLLADFNQI